MEQICKEVDYKIRKNLPFMTLMRSEFEIESLLMDLWRTYEKNPSYVLAYLKKCKFQVMPNPKKWIITKEASNFRKLKKPNPKYSQLYTDFSTLVEKMKIFKRAYNKFTFNKVLIIGDDDLLCFLLASNFKNLEITVLEIDKHIINYIKRISKNRNFNIYTEKYDVKKPLPTKFLKNFDYFFFDSSHCLGGYIAFLIRCINSLSKNGYGGQFVIQLIDDTPVFTIKERRKLFAFLRSHGLDISVIKKQVVTYEIPEEIIKRFIKGLLSLFNQRSSKKVLINFLNHFGFSEFLPGVSLQPETIIEVKTTENLVFPSNISHNKSLEEKWGKMYFYQYYEKK